MSKELILLRGIPGSGKSTIANLFGSYIRISADDFHTDENGVYNWKPENAKEGHIWCQKQTLEAMRKGYNIVVHNTFTQEWEMKFYFDMAKNVGYRVHTLIVENRHGSNDIHNVPDLTKISMKSRFQVNL